jgi:hypothetical protein
MAREMIDPTPALHRLVEAVIRPLYGHRCRLLREILPRGAPPRAVERSAKSVVGQVLLYHHAAAVLELLDGRPDPPPDGIPGLAAHITAFTLGGAGALRPRRGGRA